MGPDRYFFFFLVLGIMCTLVTVGTRGARRLVSRFVASIPKLREGGGGDKRKVRCLEKGAKKAFSTVTNIMVMAPYSTAVDYVLTGCS